MKKIKLPRKRKKALIKTEGRISYFMAIALGNYEIKELGLNRNPFYKVTTMNEKQQSYW